jgi:hypothetical protein
MPALCLWLVVFGGVLYLLPGSPAVPSVPTGWPALAAVERWLLTPTSVEGGLADLVPLLKLVGWLIWGITAWSVVLELAIGLADAATGGARWVHALRRGSHWCTLPVVRHVVETSLSGLLLARVSLQPAAVEAAALVQPSLSLTFSAQDAGAQGADEAMPTSDTAGPRASRLCRRPGGVHG